MIENPEYYAGQYIKVIHNSEEIIVKVLNLENSTTDNRRHYLVMTEGDKRGFLVDDSQVTSYQDAVSQLWLKVS